MSGKQPEITIRILDMNGSRLAMTERELRRRLKQYGIEAKTICLGCGLEIARRGFANDTPALLMNQYTVSAGEELTPERLDTFCEQLLHWITTHTDVA